MNKLIAVLFFLSVNSCIFSQNKITDYQVFIGEYIDVDNGIEYIVLRKFKSFDDSIKYLVLNPSTLNSSVIFSSNVKQVSWHYLENKYKGTTYIKLRNYSNIQKRVLKNAGIQNIKVDDRYIITTDLCPSVNKFDYSFYEDVYKEISYFALNAGTSFTLPVAIAISGAWIKYHKDDLKWLLEMQKNKKLSITWINHSYTHRYIRGRDLESNFLLIKGTDISNEILKTEELMMEEGLDLSIYFRFPGLISNESIYNQVIDYGLIPIGADSWIGKGQYPVEGSIVLVHTNGNESKGLYRFQKWLKKNKDIFYVESINNMVTRYFQ